MPEPDPEQTQQAEAESFRLSLLVVFGEKPGWQSRAADAIGLNRSNISRYLNAQVPPPGPLQELLEIWKTGQRTQAPRPMTPEEFKSLGETLFPGPEGWQNLLSLRARTNKSNVSRWASGKSPIPMHMALFLRELAGSRDQA